MVTIGVGDSCSQCLDTEALVYHAWLFLSWSLKVKVSLEKI